MCKHCRKSSGREQLLSRYHLILQIGATNRNYTSFILLQRNSAAFEVVAAVATNDQASSIAQPSSNLFTAMMIQSIRTQNVLWTKVGDFKAPSSTAQPIAGLEGFTISRFWHCNLLRMGRVNWIGLSLSGFLCKVPKRTVITAGFSQVSTVLSQSF